MSTVSSREEAARRGSGRRYEEVEGFRIQSLTHSEVVAIRAKWQEQREKSKSKTIPFYNETLLIASLVDDNNRKLFSEGDEKIFEDWDGLLVEKLAGAIQYHSGFLSGSVKEFLKNFDTATA